MPSNHDMRNLALHLGWLLVPKYFGWFAFLRRRLKKYRDRHVGENCIIIGNGPSLNNMDLSLLKGCNTIGMNKIHLLFDKTFLDLSYHVSVNDHVLEQCQDVFWALECDSFISYEGASGGFVSKLFDDFNYLLVGGELRFNEDISYPISAGSTVTFVAMQLAYYMGFRNVYLIGVDHSFKCNGKPHETQYLEGEDVNHFDPNYFSGSKWQLPDLEGSEAAYHLADYYFRKCGRNIYDATVAGQLNIFPKVSFQEAVSQCKRNA